MKILQVFCRYQERGGEEIAVENIGRLLGCRHEVEELYFDNHSLASGGWAARILLPIRFFWNAAACRRFEEKRDAFQPDLILMHNLFPAGSAGVWVKALAGTVPVIYFIHNFRPFSVSGYCWADGKIEPAGLRLIFWPEIRAGAWQNSRVRTALYAAVLYTMHWAGVWKKVPCWIAISGFIRQQFISAGIAPERIHLLPYSWEWRSGARSGTEPAGSGNAAPRFLFLGRLSEEKGVLVLLEAWRIYCESGGAGRLTIAGNGPLWESLSARVSDYPQVTFTGHVSGGIKQQLLDDCSALVVPSVWWEPFGLVAYEAYESSKPVLGAASGGLAEIVLDGKTGWLHEPGNARQLGGQLLEAARNPDEMARRGLNGRAWLEQAAQAGPWLDSFERIASPLVERQGRKA